MATDNEPELATNEEWRTIMVRARKDHGLSQEQLGDQVGTSQVMISKIESGAAGSSTFILPICRVLQIPEPAHFANEEQREWSQLGHVLRHGNPEQYESTIQLLRSLVKQIQVSPEPPANDERPARRR